jgi:excinuclease ABC subunit A
VSVSKVESGPQLSVRGARVHNLHNVDLDIPRDSLVVFTGLSGSGKSSLAFDTIFAEGQRRYVESLSAYARQFLGQVDRPDVDFIEGLSPAVSIDQKSTNRNPRSTVGTITEIYDYMRLLWARIGVPHCAVCGEVIQAQTVQQIADQLMELESGTRYQVLSPIVSQKKGEFVDLFKELAAGGYSRAIVDGNQIQLNEPPTLKKQVKHDIAVVVDRLVAGPDLLSRLTDSLETALKLTDGLIQINYIDREGDGAWQNFSEKLSCPNNHPVQLTEIEPRTFSFNAPFGACPECSGLGTRMSVDADLLLGDPELSIAEGVVLPWTTQGKGLFQYYEKLLDGLARDLHFSLDTPWGELSEEVQNAVLRGDNFEVRVKWKNRYGREMSYTSGFEGVVPYIERQYLQAETDTQRQRWGEYLREVPCQVCNGTRLKPEVLAVRVHEASIADVCELSLSDARAFMNKLELTEREATIAAQVLREIKVRLDFLIRVGLNYLNLARAAATLSGGEAQRIRLATQIGSGLTGVLYVLDEPSIGLHQRDNRRLIETLVALRDLGNTLIVVEHDEDTIRTADWVVDIGPGAGVQGGHVVHSGSYADLLTNTDSLTGDYLAGRKSIPTPTTRREIDPERQITVTGAEANNLRKVTASFPLGTFTAVTGVSGSGKSSLVNDVLYRVLANRLNGARKLPGKHTRQGHPCRPGPDRTHPALQPGHLHGSLRQDPHALLRDDRGQGPRVPARPVQLQRQGRPLRGVLRRRHDQDRDEFPARRVCRLRGVRGSALQPRHPYGALQGQEHRRSSRHAHQRGRRLLRTDLGDPPVPEDAGRGGARLRSPGPERNHALRRRGPAGEARHRTAAPLERAQCLRARRADDRAALRGRAQTPACAEQPRRQGQHGHRDRAQPRRDQVG